MDILCLHYYYPPLRSTAVIRNYQFTLNFADVFDKVHVLTSENHKHFPMDKKQLSKNISVVDIPTFDYRTLMGKRAKKGKDAHISMKKKQGALFQLLHKLQRSHPTSLLLGEGGLYYMHHAYKRACHIIESNEIKVLYSSYAPYADHYIAYKLKKKYPHLRWIADFRDLQIEPIYKSVLWKSWQQKVERKTLSLADKVITVSESYADQLKIYDRPTQSIMRGVSPRAPQDKYEKFTISYTGSLYFDYRDPSYILESIASLIGDGELAEKQIQIIYAGRDGAQFLEYIKKYKLHKIFLDRGMVTQQEAKNIQSRSHLNLLLTSSSPELKGVMTGKLFEYLEAPDSPIICLINGVKDPEFEALFDKLNAGIVAYNPPSEPDRLKNFLLKMLKNLQQTGSMQHITNKSVLIDEFSWGSQVKKMLS